MSKQRTQKRQVEVTSAEAGSEVARRGEEITHEFDDSPLPSADGLLKLQSIDPSIVPRKFLDMLFTGRGFFACHHRLFDLSVCDWSNYLRRFVRRGRYRLRCQTFYFTK